MANQTNYSVPQLPDLTKVAETAWCVDRREEEFSCTFLFLAIALGLFGLLIFTCIMLSFWQKTRTIHAVRNL